MAGSQLPAIILFLLPIIIGSIGKSHYHFVISAMASPEQALGC